MDHRGRNPKEGRLPIFVHSALDDYGLSLIEFRLCARVARRGSCYESLACLANDFHVSEQTIRRAFRVLVRCKILKEARAPGLSTEFTLNPFSEWAHASELVEIRESVFGKPLKRRQPSVREKYSVATPTSRVTPATGDRGNTGDTRLLTPEKGPPLTPGIDKGTPFEGTPFERTPKNLLPHTPADERNVSGYGVRVREATNSCDESPEINPWSVRPWSYMEVAQHVDFRIASGENIHTRGGLIRTILRNQSPVDYSAISESMADIATRKARETERREARQLEREAQLKELDRLEHTGRARQTLSGNEPQLPEHGHAEIEYQSLNQPGFRGRYGATTVEKNLEAVSDAIRCYMPKTEEHEQSLGQARETIDQNKLLETDDERRRREKGEQILADIRARKKAAGGSA
jgi:hypothetical protein